MNSNTIPQPYWDVLYLAACALNEKSPEADKLRSMDLAGVYRAASRHGMAAMTAMAIQSCGDFRCADPELARRWMEIKEKAIRKNILLDAERAQILDYLESEGIWYVPLKGSVLKELYPKYGMREMADNDILIDPAGRERIHAFMTARGYAGSCGTDDAHDSYRKPPVYNFEMHPSLFRNYHDPAWLAYFGDVKERLEPAPGRKYGYCLRGEDFYLYNTVHAFKHYKGAGTGLRVLADSYIIRQAMASELDWAYIHTASEKLGIADFDQQLCQLSEKLFRCPEHFYELVLSEDEEAFLSELSGSGTYGTFSNLIGKRLERLGDEDGSVSRKTKLRYYWSRLFPGREWLEKNYPFFARHRILVPFFWVYRLFRGVVLHKALFKQELQAIHDAKEKK